jgi:hypothetical protein
MALAFIIEATHSLLRRPAYRVLDSVNLAFAAHGSYIGSITNFGDYAADAHLTWLVQTRNYVFERLIAPMMHCRSIPVPKLLLF